MNIVKTGPLHRFAALLVLAGCSTLAGAAETGAPLSRTVVPSEAADSTQPVAAEAASGGAVQSEACASGACAEADVEEQNDVAVRAGLLPKLDLPALLGTEDTGEEC